MFIQYVLATSEGRPIHSTHGCLTARTGSGALCNQRWGGEERPIAYFSKRLLLAVENYSASELECLAIVKAIDHFTIHLLGKPFTVVTDHRALATLQTPNKLNGRLMRWALALQAYNFKVQHRPGSKHQNADGLSRQSWPDGGDTEKGEGTPTPGITLSWGSTQHDLSGQLEPQSL